MEREVNTQQIQDRPQPISEQPSQVGQCESQLHIYINLSLTHLKHYLLLAKVSYLLIHKTTWTEHTFTKCIDLENATVFSFCHEFPKVITLI